MRGARTDGTQNRIQRRVQFYSIARTPCVPFAEKEKESLAHTAFWLSRDHRATLYTLQQRTTSWERHRRVCAPAGHGACADRGVRGGVPLGRWRALQKGGEHVGPGGVMPRYVRVGAVEGEVKPIAAGTRQAKVRGRGVGVESGKLALFGLKCVVWQASCRASCCVYRVRGALGQGSLGSIGM